MGRDSSCDAIFRLDAEKASAFRGTRAILGVTPEALAYRKKSLHSSRGYGTMGVVRVG